MSKFAGARILFDAKLRRPGCVLLQAAFVKDFSIAHQFPSETWLLAPTPDMRVYVVESDEQLARLVEIAREAVQ